MRRSIGVGLSAAAFVAVLTFTSPVQAKAGYCPPGHKWSYLHKRCKPLCMRGKVWDAETGRCTEFRDECPANQFWSKTQQRCLQRCQPGQEWDGARCKVVAAPVHSCPPGWHFDGYYGRCVYSRRCPRGTHWDGWQCVAWRRCPDGHYFSAHFRECRPRIASCPAGYRYRPGYGCVPRCPIGWYWSGGSCTKVAKHCPSNMFYSYALRRCVRKCGLGFYWSFTDRRCRPRTW